MPVASVNGAVGNNGSNHSPMTGTTLTNGPSNKAHRHPDPHSESHNEQREKMGLYSSLNHSSSSSTKLTIFRQSVAITRSKLIDLSLSHVNTHYIDSITAEALQEYIKSVRLFDMPERGSQWDKALNLAELFTEQVSGYETTVNSFVPEIKPAARLIWSACRVLIEVSIPLLLYSETMLSYPSNL
jgi:hypothetical protein